jgi:tetratricopeptide (TPR) repeat protein
MNLEPAQTNQRLWRVLSVNFAKAQELFEEYKNERSDMLNRLLLNEFKPAIIRKLSLPQQYQTFTFLGDIARRSYLHKEAHDYHRWAYETTQEFGTPLEQVDALVNLHNSTWRNNPQESLKLLNQAFQICEQEKIAHIRLPKILYELGFTCHYLQNLDQAIDYYEQARTACRQQESLDLVRLATILNDLAHAYYLRGDHRALSETYLNLALKYRKHYEAEIKRSETASANDKAEAALHVGMALNTSGEIFRYKNHIRTAIERYTEALKFFVEDKNYEWQVKALTGRGEALRRLAAQQRELFPEESAGHTRKAELDFDSALDLCSRYSIINESDTANRRKGRSLHDRALVLKETDKVAAQSLLQEARQHFERGLEFARRLNDDLEQLENLTEIVFLGDDETELAAPADRPRLEAKHQQTLNELAALINRNPPVYQLPVFANLLEMERAAHLYVLGNYDEALKHYLHAFSKLAADSGYGATRYHAHLDHLKSRIETLPDLALVQRWCAAFIKVWQQTLQNGTLIPLVEVHPDLVVWCEEYAGLLTRG